MSSAIIIEDLPGSGHLKGEVSALGVVDAGFEGDDGGIGERKLRLLMCGG